MAAASGIICQGCGIEAPTRKVSYHQNIGMLVMRTHRQIDGMLCKRCVNKHFWKMTGTTLFLGPWGMISLILAPIFIINNLVHYIGAVGMPAVPADAKVPVLTDQAVAQLQPHAKELIDRLNNKEPLADIARDIAPRAKVTPGQVVKYVVALSQQARAQPPARVIPVEPLKPIPVASKPPVVAPIPSVIQDDPPQNEIGV